MKVKCIGGPNDGEWHNLPDNFRLNDIIQVQGKSRQMFKWSEEDSLLDTVTVSHNHYQLKELCFNRPGEIKPLERYKYLVPVGEDEWKCLVAQLEK